MNASIDEITVYFYLSRGQKLFIIFYVMIVIEIRDSERLKFDQNGDCFFRFQ